MTEKELHAIVGACIDLLEVGFTASVPRVLELLRAAGIERNVHVGRPPEWFTAKTELEWFAGQIVETLEAEAWFAVNSMINVWHDRKDGRWAP